MKELRGKNFWIIFAISFVTLIFTGGIYNISVFVFISPVFLMMITRNTTKVLDFILVALILGIAQVIKCPGVIDSGFPYDQIVGFLFGFIWFIPVIVDKFIYNAFTKNSMIKRKFVATLIFPCIASAFDIVLNFTQLGSIVTLSATQYGNLTLFQFASIAGQLGVTFVITWVPSVIYFLIDTYFASKKISLLDFFYMIKKPIGIFLSVLLVINIYGELRIDCVDLNKEFIKVAYGNGVECLKDESGNWLTGEITDYKNACENQIKIAAMNKASLIVFPEETVTINGKNEKEFLDFLCKQAKEDRIYVSCGVEVEYDDNKTLSDNCVVNINPNGKIISRYSKSKLVPIVETGDYKKGESKPPLDRMQLGKSDISNVSTTICYEGEFYNYVNEVDKDTDILLNPSFEWIYGLAYHTPALRLRAIEHGMSVIEPTIYNNSAVFDCYGNQITTSSTRITDYDEVFFAHIPAKGVNTLYDMLYHFTDYLYLPGLAAFIIFAVLKKRKLK